jgi:regulator of protease activity HflC (stomatin/prohibitin superfamily)
LLEKSGLSGSNERPPDLSLAAAGRARNALLVIGLVCLAACPMLLAEEIGAGYLARLSLDPISLRLAAASFALLSGAFLATALVTEGRLSAMRRRGARRQEPAPMTATRRGPSLGGRLSALIGQASRFSGWMGGAGSFSAVAQAIVMLLATGAAFVILLRDWPLGFEIPPSAAMLYKRGAAILVAAFPLLLAERYYGSAAAGLLPEAPKLQALLRVALLIFVCEAALSLIEGYGFGFAYIIEPFLRALLLLVAGELALRAATVFFQPTAGIETLSAAVSSSIAALLRPGRMRGALRQSLEQQLGIDLSRSWALQFLRSAILPVGLLLGIIAWGLTGVTALGPDQRGIYERLGSPVAVLKPGLHLGLPWPLGIVRRVDYGVIHALPLGIPDMQAILSGEVATVEGAPPPSADRLWDESHPAETSYLIASDASGRSAFQIVDIDVKLLWRIGLNDEAALASFYRASDPQPLLRAFAGRILARYFSTRTLLGALGEKREGLSDDLRQGLQAALEEAGTGIELVSVVVESMHPPAKAADSYHEVQAAHIRSEAMIAEANRQAILVGSEAQRQSIASLASAHAAAAERVTAAQTDALRFETDERAFLSARSSYLFERYLATLTGAFSSAPITLLDHRIVGAGGATIIDMRSLRAMISPPPDEDIGEKEPSK